MSTEQAPYGVSYIASAPEELKVGDRVEMINPKPHLCTHLPVGEKGVIKRIDNFCDEPMYVVQYSDKSYGVTAEYLRKLPDTISFEEKDNPMNRQVGGNHYDMPIQPVEFIERNGLGFCVGNCIKYLCRYQKKNGKQDLEKAKHYIDLLIQLEYPE